MGKGGGRPGNPGVWEHFTKLEGGKVKCNYCGHSFSAGGGTTRMKAHIHKLKGQGVRPCSAIIPQSNNEAKDQERIQGGSSFVSNCENEDLQVLKYVFEHLRPEDNVFISPLSHLTQAEFIILKPEAFFGFIDAFVEILTHIERNKKTTPSNWYLPVTFSTTALGSDEANFKSFVRDQKMIENYMSEDLNSCEKMFIPVHFGETHGGHFYLYIIHLKNKEIEIWDPLPNTSLAHRHKTTENLLLALEKLFEKVAFTKFRSKIADDILFQANRFDCGVFVINFMEQSDNFVKRNPKFQYDSKKEREDLALKLLKSDLNQEKQNLYKEARRCCAQVEKKDCNKRLRVDTSDDERGNTYDNSQKGSSKGYLLPTTDLIGEEFQSYIERIWKWITEDEEVSAIGVWGMGGSGKTALATHIHNKLILEKASRDMKVIWVTVSQNSVSHLQKVIARSIELDISDEFEVKRIAGKLLQAFKEMKKCVIILDDVWDHFFLKDVGFPMSDNRIKLILTTRIWEVCQGMDCEKNTVRVEPLDEDESRDLFENITGVDLPEEGIVEDMPNFCEGLPLAIVRIATSMRGEKKASEWRRMSECLENLGSGQYEMGKWVLPVLRSSYDFLNEKSQRFFLYCVMSTGGPFHSSDATDRLTRRFAYGSIDETKMLRVEYNECYNMLDKLQNHGMLERDDIRNGWRIHKFFRVLAIGIAEGGCKIMAYAYKELTEIPSDDQWKEDLQEVFLTGNKIQTIPDGMCPRCSQLSTLLLDRNRNLNYISDGFFNNMPALKTLDLSKTSINRLPESVSNLKCLIALLLSGCKGLSYIPSLMKLTRLMSLDLSFTAIKEAPVGLESLVNVRCLNLLGTVKLVMSASLLCKLIKLECLEVDCALYLPDNVTAQLGIQVLEKLGVIVACFRDISVFNEFASFVDQHLALRSYHLTLREASGYSYVQGINWEYFMKRITLEGMELGNREIVLPGDIEELYIWNCRQGTGARYLCSDFYNPSRIERLDIRHYAGVECLCCFSRYCSFCSSSQLVGSLSLFYLNDLKYLVSPDAHSLDDWPFPFSDLTDLFICKCDSMETLMTPRLLAGLQSLRTIFVGYCDKMKEIVGEDHSEMELPNLELPNLTSLILINMRELNSVYRGVMICPSLQKFSADWCRQLNLPQIEISRGSAIQMEKTSEERYHWEK